MEYMNNVKSENANYRAPPLGEGLSKGRAPDPLLGGAP